MPTNEQPDGSNSWVQTRIDIKDPWYVGGHFAWAEKPEIVPIYAKRLSFFQACIERVREHKDQNVRMLDAGCGDGYWISKLQSISNLDIEGIDYNPLRVARIKERFPSVKVTAVDLMKYETQRLFDIVFLNQVIEHVEDDEALLKRLRGVLRPRGVLIVGTTNEGCFLQQLSLKRRGETLKTDHVHFYLEKDIRRKIVSSGFNIQSVMREVFYPGHDRIYYGLTKRRWGFKLLESMTTLFPSQCSDYYFYCVAI